MQTESRDRRPSRKLGSGTMECVSCLRIFLSTSLLPLFRTISGDVSVFVIVVYMCNYYGYLASDGAGMAETV